MFPGKLLTPTAAHIAQLADTMQEADVQECWALGRMTPFDALSYSVLGSRDPKCWVVNDRVITMFGLASITQLTDHSVPWVLCSNQVQKLYRPFLRGSKILAEQWKSENRVLRNWVDARHTRAISWIKWMGFTLKPAVPLGPDQMPFHQFEWVRPNEHPSPPSGT